MADRIAVKAAKVGDPGASYRKLLNTGASYVAKAAGDYVINETNFPGISALLPCLAVVSLTPGAGGATIAISSDDGTTWFTLATGTAQFGLLLYLDTANTIRITITANPADVRIFVV